MMQRIRLSLQPLEGLCNMNINPEVVWHYVPPAVPDTDPSNTDDILSSQGLKSRVSHHYFKTGFFQLLRSASR